MTDCYECYKTVQIDELVIFEDGDNWKLGCVHCVKPMKFYDVKIKELREDETK
ncbi:MAG: hypothetical protein ACW99G_21610 [Candidatus Thorarchaeota archaeon]|jgi:hypothetical protein